MKRNLADVALALRAKRSSRRIDATTWLVLALWLWALPTFGELTVTVSPGYSFSSGEVPTTSKLNRLGLPTISVTGTLSGTNSIGAGTVTGTQLSDTTVDDSTINFNSSSPRAIQIKNSGVGTNQIKVDIAGLGLGGGGGFPLSNKVDNVRIIISSDVVTFSVPTNTVVGGGTNNLLALGSGLAISGGTLFPTNIPGSALLSFTSIEYSLAAGQIADTNHSLGATPSICRWVIVCKTNDNSYVPGDEVPVVSVQNTTGDNSFVGGANATNVFLVFIASGASLRAKDTGSLTTINIARWRAKCTARP